MKINFRATPHYGTVTRMHATAAILAARVPFAPVRHTAQSCARLHTLVGLPPLINNIIRRWRRHGCHRGYGRSSRRVLLCRLWRTGIVVPVVVVCVVPMHGCDSGGRHICVTR